MQTFTLTAAALTLSVLIGAPAHADNVEPNNVPFQGVYSRHHADGATRAQVAADMARARAQDVESNVEPNNLPFQAAVTAGKTRAQVKAELAQAYARDQVSNVEPNNLPFQGTPHAAPARLAGNP